MRIADESGPGLPPDPALASHALAATDLDFTAPQAYRR
jgi:hypothetical protein